MILCLTITGITTFLISTFDKPCFSLNWIERRLVLATFFFSILVQQLEMINKMNSTILFINDLFCCKDRMEQEIISLTYVKRFKTA